MLRYWFLFGALTALSQDLTLEQIMKDPIWMGEIPSSVRVAGNEEAIYFRAPRAQPRPSRWIKLNLVDGSTAEVTAADLPEAKSSAVFSDGNRSIYEIEGELWSSEGKNPPRPLLAFDEPLQFVRFSSQAFLFRKGNQLFRHEFATGATVCTTDFILEDEPEKDDTLYIAEDKKLFKYVADLHERNDINEQEREQQRRLGSRLRPAKTYLGKDLSLGNLGVDASDRYMLDASADGCYAAIVLQPKEEGTPTEYAEFINEDSFLRARNARPRVGHDVSTWKLGFVDLAANELRWLDISDLPDLDTDRLEEIKQGLSEEDRNYLPEVSEGPRPVLFSPAGFQRNSQRYLVTVFSRDFKDKWMLLIDPQTMDWELIEHQYDPAWVPYFVRGLDISRYVPGAAFWAADGETAAFLSDRTGYQHLYRYDLNKKKVHALTSGAFEIHHPFQSSDGKHWYFHSNDRHPGEYQFYRMPAKGGRWTALTEGEGIHNVTVGPHENLLVDLFSRTNRPPIIRVKRGEEPWKTLYDGRSETFKALAFTEAPVISYQNRDGKPVYARLYRPQNPNGAAVVFVHGAGYLQNAHKGWSIYFREFMFHNLLMRQGYTVLDPDYRASAGYGRDWRTAIYRHMGGKDLNDVLDGASYLISEHGIDKSRIGVYGGSYGGFIALMAMFTSPDSFKAGAALRPVTDWAYYNHWYTARILNTPFEDPEAYRRSSPIYFAEGLKGSLLICHGMVDNNVHYQDSVRLAQRLIELGKKDWQLSSYPVEPHGFKTAGGWYDEYRRIHELFERTLDVPAGSGAATSAPH